MIEQLNILFIWLDSTGAEYTLTFRVSDKSAAVITVAVYHGYWKAFSATDYSAVVDMMQDIKQFLKL